MTHPLSEAGTSVEVKPLEWTRAPFGAAHTADSIVGEYVASTHGATSVWFSPDDGDAREVQGDLASAKAAAQADYRSRILSALIQPTPAETEAGELDASRAIVDAWCDRYANGMPPVTARDKLATDILALVKRSPTPPPIGDGDKDTALRAVRADARKKAQDTTEEIMKTIRGARSYIPVGGKQAIVELLTKRFSE